MLQRLNPATPFRPTGPLLWLGASVAWAFAMVVAALVAIHWLRGGTHVENGPIAAVFAIGGFLAFGPANRLAEWISSPARLSRIAAHLVCLGAFTAGLTALAFAIQYRTYYAQWHGEFLTELWFWQLAFTLAAALYQFAVMGLILFIPLGVPALLITAILLAVRPMRD